MAVVRRRDPIPLYVQVKEAIAARIRAGTYPVGERLPREGELAREFGVGVATVKQAVNSLAMEGVVTRRAGQGTFVAGVAPASGSVPLRSFTEAMSDRGVTVSSRLLSYEVGPAGARIAWHLDTSDDAPVLHVRRLRLAAGEPVALQDFFVPADLLPAAPGSPARPELPDAWLDEEPLYRMLEERYGLTLMAAEESVWAQAAGAEEAGLLHVAAGTPILIAERTTEATGHRRVSFTRTHYRSDRFVLRFRMARYRPA
ncbi:MAG: GntR family transcriptional regulator [Limnochordaceae bacterium]|nr:GntR family transcriptional regulator [Limnochordaceae bacterium]